MSEKEIPQNVIDAVANFSKYLGFLQETLSRSGKMDFEYFAANFKSDNPVNEFTNLVVGMQKMHEQVKDLDTTYEAWKKRKRDEEAEPAMCPGCNTLVPGLYGGVCIECKPSSPKIVKKLS